MLAFLVPALLCVVLGALAARVREGPTRRSVQALAVASAFVLAFRAITSYLPGFDGLSSATQVVPLLVLPVAALSVLDRPELPFLSAVGLGWLLFARLGSAPGWAERCAAVLSLTIAWSACRGGPPAKPEWRMPLVLGTFAGAIALACLCGRVATLALVAAGLGAAIGANFLACLRWPAWSLGVPGADVALFALGGTLGCAVYLGELSPVGALVLLGSLLATRLPTLLLSFGVQLALTATALWIAWPANGIGE